jgi:hypothetical protein
MRICSKKDLTSLSLGPIFNEHMIIMTRVGDCGSREGQTTQPVTSFSVSIRLIAPEAAAISAASAITKGVQNGKNRYQQ